MGILKLAGIIIGILLAVALAYFWLNSNQQIIPPYTQEVVRDDVTEETKETSLDSDIYPLYDGAKWGQVVSVGDGVFKIQSEPFTNTTNIAAISIPFTKYYDEKLLSAGWTLDMMREASGPGANSSTYTKGNRFVTISFESDFKVKKEDAPSECPCDITLSIATGLE